jgi:hypothetical protein
LSKDNSNRYPEEAAFVPNDALRIAESPIDVDAMKEFALVGGLESGGLLPQIVVPFNLKV